MRKKFILIISIILLILVCVIVAKFIQFNNIYNHMKENYKITNFEVIIYGKNAYKAILTRKDNVIKYKTYSKDKNNIKHTFTFYTDGNTNYVFNENDNTYNILEEDFIGSSKNLYSVVEFQDEKLTFFEKFKKSLETEISKAEKNGKECYRIIQKYEDDGHVEFYIDSETYLLVYSSEVTFENYKLNSITEYDVQMPDVNNYKFLDN